VPTPVFYFSIQHLQKQGGVMVTASHNPKEYNGFQLCIDLDSIHGAQFPEIGAMIKAGDFETGQGDLSCAEVGGAYETFVSANIRLARPLRVGVDAGNGTAGVVAVPILKNLGCEVHDLFCEMDGTFPNHGADPTVLKNMQDLIGLVKKEKLDLGIGFDGDGDRIGVVEETGSLVFGDKLMILFAREILSRKPGATFIGEVKCSHTMYADLERHGGRAAMWKTGHSLSKKKKKEEKAELAGEMSGHMFFADRYFGFDDATYACCRLLEIVAAADRPVSALLADVPATFSTPEIRVDCPDNKTFEVVRQVTERFRATHKVIDIDGVRVLFDDGWGLVRASNTQPALVLRFEALSEKRRDEIRALVEGAVAEAERKV